MNWRPWRDFFTRLLQLVVKSTKIDASRRVDPLLQPETVEPSTRDTGRKRRVIGEFCPNGRSWPLYRVGYWPPIEAPERRARQSGNNAASVLFPFPPQAQSLASQFNMPWDRRRARKEPIQTGAAYIQLLGGVEFVKIEGGHPSLKLSGCHALIISQSWPRSVCRLIAASRSAMVA